MSRSQERVATQGKSWGDLLVMLKEAQDKFGYVPEELMTDLAKSLDMPLSDVYGVASFYSLLSTKPQGRHVIRICKSLPCWLKNSEVIIENVAQEIGISPGQTTPDGRFSLELTNCIGACDKAPAMMINCNVHGDLTPGKIAHILKLYE